MSPANKDRREIRLSGFDQAQADIAAEPAATAAPPAAAPRFRVDGFAPDTPPDNAARPKASTSEAAASRDDADRRERRRAWKERLREKAGRAGRDQHHQREPSP